MVNTDLLKEKMKNSGMTITAIASKAGMKRETLYNRMASGDFKVSEATALIHVLGLTEIDRKDIFFSNEVN